MLTITEDNNPRPAVSVSVDAYIPLSIEVDEDGGQDVPDYWRFLDGTVGLVEIGVERRWGFLRSITLTSVAQANIFKRDLSGDEAWHACSEALFSVPRDSPSSYVVGGVQHFVDTEASIEFWVDSEMAAVVFGTKELADYFCVGRDVRLGVDARGVLQRVLVRGLPPEQLSRWSPSA